MCKKRSLNQILYKNLFSKIAHRQDYFEAYHLYSIQNRKLFSSHCRHIDDVTECCTCEGKLRVNGVGKELIRVVALDPPCYEHFPNTCSALYAFGLAKAPWNRPTCSTSFHIVLDRHTASNMKQLEVLKCGKNLERFTNLRVILAQGPC